MARPRQVQPGLSQAGLKLCRLGRPTKELADFFGVAESTLNKWKRTTRSFRSP